MTAATARPGQGQSSPVNPTAAPTPSSDPAPSSAGRWRRSLLRGLALLAAAYAAVVVAMYFGQAQLLYRPDATAPAIDPTRLPRVQPVTLATADGQRLVAWWAPPRAPGGPVVLYLHGNGANLAARSGRFGWITEARGAGLLAVSWRGYGGSTGAPSEAGLMADAQAAWRALTDPADASLPGRGAALPPSRVVLFGESLGTTVAVMLAAQQQQPAALVLDSAFDSVLDVARRQYTWLPVAALLRDPFRADLAAPRVAAPVLQVQCRDDPITPTASALALHARLPQARPMVWVEDRCHTPSLRHWTPQLAGFLDGLGL
jgi:pimeloyl-ACP methyl ester carboxylesterase